MFVTQGIDGALNRAREAAGSEDVLVSGGADIARQYLEAGRSRSSAFTSCPWFWVLARDSSTTGSARDPPAAHHGHNQPAGDPPHV